MAQQEMSWVSNPLDLFKSLTIIPNDDMSDAQKFNALSRAIMLSSGLIGVVTKSPVPLISGSACLIMVALFYGQEHEGFSAIEFGPTLGASSADIPYDAKQAILKRRSEFHPNVIKQLGARFGEHEHMQKIIPTIDQQIYGARGYADHPQFEDHDTLFNTNSAGPVKYISDPS